MIQYFRGRLLAVFTGLVALVVALPADAPPAAVQPGPAGGQWTATWSTSMVAATPDIFGMPNWSGGFSDQSVRQPVRASRGGSAVRIRISNVFGTGPLRLTSASIGRAGAGAAVQPGTLQALSFGGTGSTTVPAGRELDSDPVPLTVAALERLTVTLYFAAPTGPASFHPSAIATSYRSAGNHLADPAAQAFGETSQSWYYLSGLDVTGAAPSGDRGAVVAFGDSITEGSGSTPDADNRYPDELAKRLVAAGRGLGVANAGISGNRLLTDADGMGDRATARFQRDALGRPGVRSVIVLAGVNDLGVGVGTSGRPPTPAQLIGGYRALIAAAHARGVRVLGATILPFKGATDQGYYTERGGQVRAAVNNWIRTSGEYDAVVDLARALADPADPDKLRAEYDSGDGLHPNDAGMRAMANTIDLNRL
ncbi:SGNH/GDSL hydrolase family protein [Amycolatopsis sp. NPDC051128]|uniref:SGNH/GDSL hydrolase family protein n=1 Tax=Amycolatopsis sp. NPDC051128 TaxID=3155412 RepID=UPI0034477ED6